jgi:hypothetical protein
LEPELPLKAVFPLDVVSVLPNNSTPNELVEVPDMLKFPEAVRLALLISSPTFEPLVPLSVSVPPPVLLTVFAFVNRKP